MSEEKCQRCGEEGQDRRTLWMSCFYAMEELKIPFEIADSPIGNIPRFYKLRVCKECRGDWLNTISHWFKRPPKYYEYTERHRENWKPFEEPES